MDKNDCLFFVFNRGTTKSSLTSRETETLRKAGQQSQYLQRGEHVTLLSYVHVTVHHVIDEMNLRSQVRNPATNKANAYTHMQQGGNIHVSQDKGRFRRKFWINLCFIPCSDDHKLEDWKQIIQRDKLLFPLPEITHFLKINATNNQNYDLFYLE